MQAILVPVRMKHLPCGGVLDLGLAADLTHHHSHAPLAGAFVYLKEVTLMFEGQPQSEVEEMMKSDPEFRTLLNRHRQLNRQVLDAELGVLPVDDTTLTNMKKEKLFAKSKLTRLFDRRAH
jgi:uncharacterized protein